MLSTGRLNINNSAALSSGTLTISGVSTLGNTTSAAITLTDNPPQIWNANLTFAGSQNLNLGTGSVTLGANRQVTVSSNTLTVGGPIGGNYSLTKAGSGVLELSGSNTFTGATTVSAGKLLVDGWLTNSAVSVNSGGTLGGTGSLANVTVNAGGHLAPGDLLGVMHLSGSLTLLANAVMDYDLDTPSTSDEVLMPTGQLILSNQRFADFHFTWSANFGPGTYDLINFRSSSGSLGTNTSGTIDGLPATLSIDPVQHDLVLTVTPEPSTLTLLAAGALVLVGYGWRRRTARRMAKPTASAQADAPAILSFPSHRLYQASAARRAA